MDTLASEWKRQRDGEGGEDKENIENCVRENTTNGSADRHSWRASHERRGREMNEE